MTRFFQFDFRKFRGLLEQRVRRDFQSRRDGAADILCVRRQRAEGRRCSEIYDDKRAAVFGVGGDSIDDPVGADLLRIIVFDDQAGLDSRSDDDRSRIEILLREVLQRVEYGPSR